MKLFPITQCDAYKLGHFKMYQEGTEFLYSNFTPRSDKLFKGSFLYDHKMVVYGIQGFICEFLIETFNEGFFNKPKEQVIERYARRVNNMLGKGTVSVEHMEALHDLGYLPIRVKSLPEGSRVKMGVPVMTVCNTHPYFAWLVNYLETVWSNSTWKSMVNATIAYEYRKVFEHYAELTGVDKGFVQFQGHDFASRGMSGPEDAARSGSAHLLSFVGTDTVSAIDYVEDYYGADSDKELIGVSVPATEHSVSSSNILFIEQNMREVYREDEGWEFRLMAECNFLEKYLTTMVPNGIASYVADTYNYWDVLTKVLPELKDVILSRDGKLVIRPDSGDPVEIICGKGSDGASPEEKGSIQILWEIFGGTINEKGYKVLDEHIGLIYGDSITLERQQKILQGLADKGFASSNVVLGIGSYTYNYSTRDSLGAAVKATATVVHGDLIEIFKDPATASSKKSAKGLLRVDLVDCEYVLKDQCTQEEERGGELRVVFENGRDYNVTTLTEIRNRLNGENV